MIDSFQKLWQASLLMCMAVCMVGLGNMVSPAHAGESKTNPVRIAVASNFLSTVLLLVPAFEKAYPYKVQVASGSTGKLYAQIVNGAPFDVFMAADVKRPEKLEKDGFGVAGSRFTYAMGQLVFWEPAVTADSTACRQALSGTGLKHLAIANPETAPYGLAAQQTLQRMHLWKVYEKRMVRGENISQTFQFVSSGAADGGFVAASQLGEHVDGCTWTVPDTYHAPLEQQAVMIHHKISSVAASDWMIFLKSEAAKKIIRQQRYAIP